MTGPAPGASHTSDEPFQGGRVVTIAAGHAVHDTFTAFLPPLLPRFIEDLSLSNTAATGLTAIMQIPSLAQFAVGRLADRTTLRWAVILAPGVTATIMSLLGWAPGYAVLALMLFAAGTSVAAFHAVAPAALGRLSGRSLGRGLGFFMVGGELGRTLGPLLVVSALGFFSLRSMTVLAVLGIATSVVLWARLRDVPLSPPSRGDAVPWRPALARMRRVMTVLSGLIAMRALMTMAAVTYLPVYLTDQGVSLFFAGASLSIVEAAGVAGALAGGWVSDRVGRRAVLAFGHLASPGFLLLLLLVDGWMRLPVLLALGFTLLSIQPVNMALVQEQFADTRAFANGVYLSLSFAIRSGAAVLFGVLADQFGLTAAFAVGAVAMLGAAPLILLLPGDPPGRTMP
jgi:FSR family fosmidomycin resistance protein-like MFS transporter